MELQDRFNGCFTHLVAEHFNKTWSRSSKIGGGNDRILRVTSTRHDANAKKNLR